MNMLATSILDAMYLEDGLDGGRILPEPQPETLKPCPFCNGTATIYEPRKGILFVHCKTPECYMSIDVTRHHRREEITRLWNRRAKE